MATKLEIEKRTNGTRVRANLPERKRAIAPRAATARTAGGADRKAGTAKAQLIRALNEDLAFFLKEVPDEQGHAQFLANKIVALGGEPGTVPRPVPPAGSNREMLAAVLEAERQAKHDYTKRARQAEQFGDKGLQVMIENIVADETGHFEETERMLKEWPD
jgi:bacterioferritin